MKISIVIPTLNEERNIREVIGGIKRNLKNYNLEIIVVDGHSADKTVNIAKKAGARVYYDNFGKGSALIKGLDAATGDIMISMDADLSHEPKELKLLIAGIEAGYDICMGSRFIKGGGSADMPVFRIFGNKVFVLLVNTFFHTNYSDLCYGYRSFKKNSFKKLGLKSRDFGIETEISINAVKRHLKVLEVPSFEKKRKYGEGKLRSFRDGYTILTTILSSILKK